jgi:hypothetical protein
MPHKGRLLFVVVLASAGLAAAGAATARELAVVSHFQCYRIKPSSPWKPVSLTVSTQFGKLDGTVLQLQALCAPASKNGSVITNKIAHLACYPLKVTTAFTPKTVLITNQFEKGTAMTVVAPTVLCVPTGKSVASTAGPPLPKGLDNYQCYSVKLQKQVPTRPITVIDQFGQAGGSTLQPVALCAPAGINGSPLLNATTHLLCYAVKLGPNVKPTTVSIRNRFGVASGVVFQRLSLCLPSVKKLG